MKQESHRFGNRKTESMELDPADHHIEGQLQTAKEQNQLGRKINDLENITDKGGKGTSETDGAELVEQTPSPSRVVGLLEVK